MPARAYGPDAFARAPGRRPRILLGLLLLVAAAAAAVWVSAPPGGDVQARVQRRAERLRVPLLEAGALPDQLVDALVATEDERFFEHHGIDVLGLSRAIGYDVASRCACQGGSTLTEQLVKVLYLDDSDAGWNKVRQAVVALKVERQIGKRQILADYLSVVQFGYGLYGAEPASEAYFGRHLDQLDLAQCALLAGMPRSPSGLDPRRHPAAARARRAEVLAAMVSESYITSRQAEAAAAQPLL